MWARATNFPGRCRSSACPAKLLHRDPKAPIKLRRRLRRKSMPFHCQPPPSWRDSDERCVRRCRLCKFIDGTYCFSYWHLTAHAFNLLSDWPHHTFLIGKSAKSLAACGLTTGMPRGRLSAAAGSRLLFPDNIIFTFDLKSSPFT